MVFFNGRGRAWALGLAAALAVGEAVADQVRTKAGVVDGFTEPDRSVRVFRGIPFAAPPVGDLRWREPRPAPAWKGVRKATEFGPRCVQGPIFDDMVFRDHLSEDCLYLNVWTPARSAAEKRPVMVWIHGGGFQAGSASEPRQDGGRLARKGVVVVGINYRLGVFGFLAHPALTKESGHGASGNYGLLDQVAALRWVRDNVAGFGGDPGNVTIFGESAGSFAVSALMASPPARGLFHRAIGESGAYLGRSVLEQKALAASEEKGSRFAASIGADSLSALRAKPADEVLQAALKVEPWFEPTIDGYVMPKPADDVYAAGEQSRVPLLAGWNADEVRAGVVLAKEKPTAKSFTEQARARFGPGADALLKAYPAASDAEALESAAALAGDMFIGYGTWKWIERHGTTGDSPVYRYSFDRKIPVAPGTKVDGVPATAADVGARHAGEIEYVFGALDTVAGVAWEPADRQLSDLMMSYWSNFARTGDPNGPGLPKWPRQAVQDGFQVMHLDATSRSAPDALRARYEGLDAILAASTQPTAAAAEAPTLAELERATYRGLEEPKGPVTLVNGRWEGPPYEPGGASRPTVTFGRDFRVTGDIDGDGAPEAVVLLAHSSGGSGTFDYLAVVKKTAAGLDNLATAPLGDRVQVRAARVEGRKLLVSVVQAGGKDAACCPGELVDREWTLEGRALTPSAAPANTGRLSLDTLAGSEWVLRAWDLAELAPSDPEVTLAYVGGRFAGKSGCNRYTAAATAGDTPGDVSVGPAAGTRMACPEPQSAVEARFLKQLGAAKKFGFVLGRLAVTYGQDGRWDTMLFEGRAPAAVTPK